MTKGKSIDSFRLASGEIVTTWGDFRKHVFPHVSKESKHELTEVMQRYQRLGKCAADLCEDMQNTVLAGRVSSEAQS